MKIISYLSCAPYKNIYAKDYKCTYIAIVKPVYFATSSYINVTILCGATFFYHHDKPWHETGQGPEVFQFNVQRPSERGVVR